ncbi:xanthine dehydrogenase/oxidase-like [Glandiceps talaboti]
MQMMAARSNGFVNFSESDSLVFYLNGKKVRQWRGNPRMTLATYLREVALLTGTKVSCGEGGCGSCTVMLSRLNPVTNDISHMCVYSCLLPLCYIHGMAVTTVEGVGSTRTRLHPVQEYIVRYHGTQCGFCTPGMVMTMYTLLRNKPKPTQQDIELALGGVICRCTGYRPILEGFEDLCSKGNECCRAIEKRTCLQGNTESKGPKANTENSDGETTQELIFPPDLLNNDSYHTKYVMFTDGYSKWIRPTNLPDLIKVKKASPMAKLVAGYNDIGLDVMTTGSSYPVMICLSHVPELNQLSITDECITIGAAVSFSQVIHAIKTLQMQDENKRIFGALVSTLTTIGGVHTQNTATFGGHIASASVNSDIIPLLMVSSCQVNIMEPDGNIRHIEFDKLMKSHEENTLQPEELIVSVCIPVVSKDVYIHSYRTQIPHRRNTTDSFINTGLCVTLESKTNTVQDMRISFGGMDKIVMLENVAARIIGRQWDTALYKDVIAEFGQYCREARPRNSEYKQSMMESFFFKFYNAVCQEANINECTTNTGQLKLQRREATRLQTWQEHVQGSVGQPFHHVAAKHQSTGEALFIDDIPPRQDELFLTLVTSTRAHAKIKSIDASSALAMEGVVCFVGADDVPVDNSMGNFDKDEEIFAKTQVTCVGQVIGGVVATSREMSLRASRLVKINYEDMPSVLTIEEAIKENSFYVPITNLKVGNTEEAFAGSERLLEGEVRIGGQEHFYMETQRCLVIPEGGDENIEVLSSTQHPELVQLVIANALGLSSNRVRVKVIRLGGGFGGKEHRCLVPAVACAVAAYRTRRPVRCVLERELDMRTTGGRHPALARYKVGFSCDGRIKALDVNLYMNAGNTKDCSTVVVGTAAHQLWNVYDLPAVNTHGYACKTNLPSNTAYRGYGIPQGMFIMETIISKLAIQCGLTEHEVRQINFCREDGNHVLDVGLEPCKITLCWDTCRRKSDFDKRLKGVNTFNSRSRWQKKGISLIPTRFPIGVGGKRRHNKENQAGALVNVYTDGSVSVNHGGIEMGQGIYTKMVQIASTVLGVPMDDIFISDTSTQVVPNQPATRGSASNDYNGKAVQLACEKIKRRLQPFVDKNPTGSWKDWVKSAHMNNVSLSATGQYGDEKIDFDLNTGQGRAALYCTYGVACSEVEIDCLTGEHQVLRTDIVMDVGRSINPAIDIGQIEGAFLQGYGFFVTEELRWSDKGELLNCGPGMYNLPRVRHLPREFNVHLLPNSDNPEAVFSSKGIGEPPLYLASSVFFAIKEAIRAARLEIGLKEDFDLMSPATQENIRMACGDQLKEYRDSK